MNVSFFPGPGGRSRAVRALSLLLSGLIGCAAGPAFAWKPATHIYLAEQAREDLLQNGGAISLSEVDSKTGNTVGSLGTLAVSSDVYTALRDHPEYYRAGVIGPDGYPDLLFGQGTIHPDENEDKEEVTWEINGADAWLQHIAGRVSTPQQRAFYLGFLAHGAGDMFAHTFVNHYAGGPFDVSSVSNSSRHISLEGYVGTHTPALASNVIDTTDVNDFIHDTLIDARRPRNGELNNPNLPEAQRARIRIWQLTEKTFKKNPVAIFTRLREGLEDKLDAHFVNLGYLRDRLEEAKQQCAANWLRCYKVVYYQGLISGYQTINGLRISYMEAWVRDINAGLRAWPQMSTDVARQLFLKPDGMDLGEASRVVSVFRDRHLCPMIGAPDVACRLVGAFFNILREITDSVDFISEMKKDALKWLVLKATNRSTDDWKELLHARSLERHIGPGTNVEVNGLMGLTDPSADFNWQQFAPAYNTVTGVKLTFLDTRQQWRTLLARVGWNPPNPDALMNLGGFNGQFLHNHLASMDGSNQWQKKEAKAFCLLGSCEPERHDLRENFLARDCALFGRFFKQQRGDGWDHPNDYPKVPETCANLDQLQPASPQLQCGGVDFDVRLDKDSSDIGGVVKLTGQFANGQPLPNTPLHAYLAPGTRQARVRFSQGLANTSSGLTVTGLRVKDQNYSASSQVETCASGQSCENHQCGLPSPGGRQQFTYSVTSSRFIPMPFVAQRVFLAEGQTLSLGTCGLNGASGTGNTLLRLLAPDGTQVAFNDDACGGTLSQLGYTVPAGGGGGYTVIAGCSGRTSCGGTVVYTIGGTYPFSTAWTDYGNLNTVDHLVPLLAGQVISLGTILVPGASGDGDSHLRLVGPSGVEVAWNDDNLQRIHPRHLSHITYTVPPDGAGTYRIRAGCTDFVGCNGTVAYLLTGESCWSHAPVCGGQALQCGHALNGCGGAVQCGACGGNQVCTQNVCTACVPRTCDSVGAECGSVPDGCGGTLSCGSCGAGYRCAYNTCEPTCPRGVKDDLERCPVE